MSESHKVRLLRESLGALYVVEVILPLVIQDIIDLAQMVTLSNLPFHRGAIVVVQSHDKGVADAFGDRARILQLLAHISIFIVHQILAYPGRHRVISL
jgi:hypothetical protein